MNPSGYTSVSWHQGLKEIKKNKHVYNNVMKIICFLIYRYLASGDSFTSLAYSYHMGISTISGIIQETCTAIYRTLKDKYMKKKTTEDWIDVAKDFTEKWNFPNCIGALDGKHVRITAPQHSGSSYFNYKGFFSMVLMALVDAKYRFIMIDVGAYGRQSDGGVFANCAFGKKLEQNKLQIPADTPISNSPEQGTFPFVLVADEAFPLKRNIMRPYPGRGISEAKRIFNYRLSRARRVVENAFGILANRFRIFHRSIDLHPKNVEKIIKASCMLHNVLQDDSQEGVQAAEGEHNQEPYVPFEELGRVGANYGTREAIDIRNKYCDYFQSVEGSLSWQENVIRRGIPRE